MFAILVNVDVKPIDVAAAGQSMMTLASLGSLKYCQAQLADKDSAYDYSTVTDYSVRLDSLDLQCFAPSWLIQ